MDQLQNQAKQKLESLGFTVELYNKNQHFKIRNIVDFYPNTGAWVTRDGTKGVGLDKLCIYLTSFTAI